MWQDAVVTFIQPFKTQWYLHAPSALAISNLTMHFVFTGFMILRINSDLNIINELNFVMEMC
jgi:hypothetical protein